MTTRALAIASAFALAVLATSPASAQTARKRVPAVARPPVASDAIIPLPLHPIVPAGQRLCKAATPSGLGYTRLRAATGAKPAKGDLVLVNYIGYLAATGAVFDQGMRAAFPVDAVIAGFSEGLATMARTEVARFCIPAAMGYGAEASGPIPADSALVFQVELLDFKPAAAAEAPPAEQPAVRR